MGPPSEAHGHGCAGQVVEAIADGKQDPGPRGGDRRYERADGPGLRVETLPSTVKPERAWRTRPDPFEEIWEREIVRLLERDDDGSLQATALPDHALLPAPAADLHCATCGCYVSSDRRSPTWLSHSGAAHPRKVGQTTTVPSQALLNWQTNRLAELDEVEAAHRAVGGGGRGRRFTTKQLNHAYAVLLCSQFQGFCRDLHSEAVDHLVTCIEPAAVRLVVRQLLTRDRKLDRGNANAGNMGSDFARLDFELWPHVQGLDPLNIDRQRKLDLAATWRNAIAHQDFNKPDVDPNGTLHLRTVKGWRSALNALSSHLDQAVATQVAVLTGVTPW